MVDKRKQGKRNQINGRIFENKVRENLEQSGWIVGRWCNNVEFKELKYSEKKLYKDKNRCTHINSKGERCRAFCKPGDQVCEIHHLYPTEPYKKGRCIPAKQGRFRKTSTGFPDFIAYKKIDDGEYMYSIPLIFVECKSNGYLDKEEKEKAKWYLENNYCSEFWVAYKETDPNDRRKKIVKYKEFKY